MSQADLDFFNKLSESLDKQAQLSEQSITALDVEKPELLQQLEEQASSDPSEEAPPEPQPEQPPEMVELAGEQQEDPPLVIPKNLFRIEEIHPLKLLMVLRYKYKDNWVEWLPETLWETIRRDIGAISEINQNKVQALAVSLSTDAPWQDWTTFENVGRAFNDTLPVFGLMQPLSPAEAAFTVLLLKKLHDFAFSGETLGYIASVCLYNGIVYAPQKWFGKVQPMIDNQNSAHDIRDAVIKAWQVVKGKPLEDVAFNDSKPVDVHVAKLWAIGEYIRGKDAQLKEA